MCAGLSVKCVIYRFCCMNSSLGHKMFYFQEVKKEICNLAK